MRVPSSAEPDHVCATFGPVPFEIHGSGGLFDAIVANFSSSMESDDKSIASVAYHIVDEGLPDVAADHAILAGGGESSASALRFEVPGFELLVELDPHNRPRYRVHCHPSPTSRRRAAAGLPRAIQRLLTSRYVTTTELQAIDFVYHVFFWTMELALLERGASLVHASSMHSGVLDETLLIAGWGGVGKTSLTSFAYLEHGGEWRFLADDLSIIDSQGRLWFNPMGIHFYPYNTQGFSELRRTVTATMSPMSRLHWLLRKMIKGNSAAVRRIDPHVLWPTVNRSKLSTACILERWTGPHARIEEMDATSYAAKAMHVLMHELKDISIPLILFNATRQNESNAVLPSLPSYIRSVEGIIEAGLCDARLLNVFVPRHWDPMELGAFLLDALGWSST